MAVFPGLAMAQDGQRAVGPPVTSPRTDANKVDTARPITDSPPPQTSNQLPAVPATAADPAPPGTRGVRVDGQLNVPGQPGGAIAPAAGGQPRTAGPNVAPNATGANVAPNATRAVPGLRSIEGVVIRLDPGKDALAEERIRIAVDPSQDWTSYVSLGATGLPHRDRTNTARRSANDAPEADTNRPAQGRDNRATGTVTETPASREGTAVDSPAQDQAVPIILTRRTYIYAFARSPEGHDLLGADTRSSPEVQESRTGETVRSVVPSPNPKEASFTNIREGSYVAVRYRTVGDVNEALNVSLIELPLNTTPATALPVGVTPSRGANGAPTHPAGENDGTGIPTPGSATSAAGASGGAATSGAAAGAPGLRPGAAPVAPGAAGTRGTPGGASTTPGSPDVPAGARIPVVPVNPSGPPAPR